MMHDQLSTTCPASPSMTTPSISSLSRPLPPWPVSPSSCSSPIAHDRVVCPGAPTKRKKTRSRIFDDFDDNDYYYNDNNDHENESRDNGVETIIGEGIRPRRLIFDVDGDDNHDNDNDNRNDNDNDNDDDYNINNLAILSPPSSPLRHNYPVEQDQQHRSPQRQDYPQQQQQQYQRQERVSPAVTSSTVVLPIRSSTTTAPTRRAVSPNGSNANTNTNTYSNIGNSILGGENARGRGSNSGRGSNNDGSSRSSRSSNSNLRR